MIALRLRASALFWDVDSRIFSLEDPNAWRSPRIFNEAVEPQCGQLYEIQG